MITAEQMMKIEAEGKKLSASKAGVSVSADPGMAACIKRDLKRLRKAWRIAA